MTELITKKVLDRVNSKTTAIPICHHSFHAGRKKSALFARANR